MKGDFSRDTYRPAAQYSRVMMQQGRVQLDSDWNEQTSILLGYMRALTRDLFGPAAGPAADCGFRIVTAETRGGLPKAVKDKVDSALAEMKADLGDNQLLVLPGRYYVGGLPVEARQAARTPARTGFPDAEVTDLGKRSWIAYLDVWEDFVSAEQDPYIRETALNGVDTCGRAHILWQVRLLLDPETEDAVAKLTQTGQAALKARANPTEEPDELCTIQPDARYRGAENQLYRVEIHVGGKAPEAAFKWSRDNGAVTFAIRSGKGKSMTLAHLGRDDTTTLVEGDWVELVDDETAGTGPLFQVAKVDRDELRVELAMPDGSPALQSYAEEDAAARHAFLRRWDQRGDLKESGGAIPIAEGAEFELEDGVKVTFEAGGTYRAGDYWLIPARVATGDVEWPGTPDKPEFRPPHGPAHCYAPLLSRTHKSNKAPEFKDMRCCIARLPCIGDDKIAATGTTPAGDVTDKK
jgi:hypothetical protein